MRGSSGRLRRPGPYNPGVIVARSFEFQAAHHLPHHPGKCHRLHGHTYRLEVRCKGPVDPASGMVVDFAHVRKLVETHVIDVLDHQLLNDFLENPTAELVAAWIWKQLIDTALPVSEIRLHETSACYVVYSGPDAT